MSASMTIVIRGGDQVLAALAKKPAQLRRAIGAGLREGALAVLRRAEENLSGKVLNVDRGRLRQSVNVFARPNEGIAGVGSNVVYAPVHEYGATFQHPGGTAYYFRKNSDLAVFLSNRKAGAHNFPRTKPHEITIPARPWLRPALRDSVPEIQKAIEQQIGAVLQVSP